MAKGKSGRSAHGTPSSLTTLLGPPPLAIQQAVTSVNTLWLQNQAALTAPPQLRGYVPEWDDPLPWQPGGTNDRRRYNPTKRSESPYAALRSATRLLINPVGTLAKRSLKDVPRFATPNLVTLCLRRKARKEVLHAFKRTGKGSGHGRRRRHLFSDVKC